MATEESAAPAAAEAAAPAPNGDSNNTKPDKPQRPPREPEKPIEELFDLSKPIPRVDRPNKDEHEKELQVLTDKIEAIKKDRAVIQAKIDEAMADPAAKGALTEKRNKLAELKAKKAALISEKKAMRTQMDVARNETEKLKKDKKDVRSNIKFSSMEEINKEINKLQRQQETTSMSLQEEKKLIKEMDALKASKVYISDLKAKDSDLDSVTLKRKTIKEQIDAKDKEIDAVSKDLDEIMDFLKAQNEKDSKKRDAIQGLFKERDGFKKQIAEIISQKDAQRAAFREKNNAWYNTQRAVREQKKIQYEEEKKRRDEERAEYEAQLAAEEAKKIPYEEEQHLCDYLADYLERTYLNAGKSEDKEAKKTDVVADTASPFAGMKAVNKKDEEGESYFGKGGGKKKRNRQNKKQQNPAAGPFTLSVDSFEQFGLLQLTPPTAVDQVANSVKELREKKEWYKQQERGSVPTAKEIRKKTEEAAAKLRKSNEAAANSKKTAKQPNPGNFSLKNDDFVPLGAAAAGGQLNSSWGLPKPAMDSQE